MITTGRSKPSRCASQRHAGVPVAVQPLEVRDRHGIGAPARAHRPQVAHPRSDPRTGRGGASAERPLRVAAQPVPVGVHHQQAPRARVRQQRLDQAIGREVHASPVAVLPGDEAERQDHVARLGGRGLRRGCRGLGHPVQRTPDAPPGLPAPLSLRLGPGANGGPCKELPAPFPDVPDLGNLPRRGATEVVGGLASVRHGSLRSCCLIRAKNNNERCS